MCVVMSLVATRERPHTAIYTIKNNHSLRITTKNWITAPSKQHCVSHSSRRNVTPQTTISLKCSNISVWCSMIVKYIFHLTRDEKTGHKITQLLVCVCARATHVLTTSAKIAFVAEVQIRHQSHQLAAITSHAHNVNEDANATFTSFDRRQSTIVKQKIGTHAAHASLTPLHYLYIHFVFSE